MPVIVEPEKVNRDIETSALSYLMFVDVVVSVCPEEEAIRSILHLSRNQ